MSTFNEHCCNIVKDYVQTVLIIDDGAGLSTISNADQLDDLPIDNPFMAQGKEEETEIELLDKNSVKTEDEDSGGSHPLNSLELTNAFYEKGIVAGLYQPQITESENADDFAKKTEEVAITADIIILDWMLKGNDQSYSKAIVKKILDCDKHSGGRIRHIIIYTGEPNLIGLKDTLYKDLDDGNIDASDEFQLSSKNLKISFYNKPHSGGRSEREVLEKNLPAKALEEFETFIAGLVPAFAMKASATIRKNTGRIIAKFDKDLDLGYVGHRALLPSPQDSEVFMLENFVSYLRNILSISKVDAESLGDDVLEKWITKNYSSFKSSLTIGEGKKGKELTFNQGALINILKFGTNQEGLGLYNEIKESYEDNLRGKKPQKPEDEILKLTKEFAYNIIKDNKKPLKFLEIFSKSNDSIGNSSKKLSIICSFKRTFVDLNLEIETPYLTQGSLILDPDESVYYLCITPKCDTARVSDRRQFSFAKMEIVEEVKKYDLVAPNKDLDGFIHLSCDTHFYNLQHFSFDGGSSNRVIGIKEGDSIMFNSAEGRRLEWVGDLADLSTQKRVSDLVGNFNRIGVDEVEWLRRK